MFQTTKNKIQKELQEIILSNTIFHFWNVNILSPFEGVGLFLTVLI